MKRVRFLEIVAGILVGLAIMYLVHQIPTGESENQLDYKAKLDSLAKVSATLELKQKRVDTLIADYNVKVSELDYKLGNIKEKTVIVREYYHEVSQQVANYNGSQVDSFLRNRYNY